MGGFFIIFIYTLSCHKKKILVYSGLDLGFIYNGKKSSFEDSSSNLGIIVRKNNTSIYSATLFSGVKYHLSPRFSVFAELGIECAYSRLINVISWGTSNFESEDTGTLLMNKLVIISSH